MGFKKSSGLGGYIYTDRTVKKKIGGINGLVREVFTRRYEKKIEDCFYYYDGELVAFTTHFNDSLCPCISEKVRKTDLVYSALCTDMGDSDPIIVNM